MEYLLTLAETDNSARNILVGIFVLIFLAIIIVPRMDKARRGK